MKTLAALLAGVMTLAVQAQELPHCASVDEILRELEGRGVRNIVELRSKDGMWIAETLDESGRRTKEFIVYCSDSKMGTLGTKEVALDTPPADGKPLKELLAKAQAEYGGHIEKASFKAGRWMIEISLDVQNTNKRLARHRVYYDPYGKLILDTYSD